MAEIFLLVLGFCYLVYVVAFVVPSKIKKVEEKVDLLQLQLKEIQATLDKVNKR